MGKSKRGKRDKIIIKLHQNEGSHNVNPPQVSEPLSQTVSKWGY